MMIMALSDVWNGFQDRYYAWLDGLEEKGVPVYKIVDPIDRYLPSLALWIVLLIAIIGLLVGSLVGLLPGVVPAKVSLTVSVKDSLGLEQEGALVKAQSSLGLEQVTTDGLGQAKFLVGKNDAVSIEVTKEGFGKFTGTATAGKAEQGFQVELKQEAETKEVTISLTDLATGALLTGKQLTVSFYCDNPLAASPASKSTVTGKVSVEVPNDCGTLSAKVTSAAGDYEADFIVISPDSPIIKLEGAEAAVGSLNVNTTYNEQPIDGVVVRVFNPSGTQVDSRTTVIGQATFALPAGSYYVRAEANDTYKEQTSDFVQLNAGDTKAVNISLSTGVLGSIELTLKDESNDALISGATVRLMFGNDIIQLKTTGSDGKAVFQISEDKTYKAAIDRSDYELRAEPGLKVNDKKVIKLKKFDPDTMRRLYVNVINEDGQPVENARVSIFNAETNFLAGLNDADTNADGVATIQNLTESGKYYAFAFKGNVKGKSDDVYVDLRHGDAAMTVTLALGDGTIELLVLDNESKPVPFAKVNVINYFDNSAIASTLTDEEGKLSFTDKADKKVYLNIVKEGFMPHTTSPIVLEQSVAKQKVVQLIQRVLDPTARPRIEFSGLFKDDKSVTEPGSGQEYTAKLKLVVPEVAALTGNVYSTAGIVFRVGDKVITEKDLLFIKKVEAPMANAFKFSAYYPDNQTDTFNSSTASDTKWVSIVYPESSGLKTGVYEVDVKVKIKDTAGLNDNLFFYYNAWGKRQDTGAIMTDPIDTDLGTTNPLNKYSAYFESKQTIYAVGLQELCDQDWCFVARITDDAQGLSYDVIDSFTAENFADYTLFFTITNNSKTKLHTNADIRIKFASEGVMIKSFEFINADGQKTSNTTFNKFELPTFALGAFTSQKRLQGTLKLRATKPINDSLRILIVSDQVPVLEKFIQFTVQATKELAAVIEPMPLVAGTSNAIKFTVTDTGTGLRLGQANIKLRDKFGNYLGTCELEASTSGDCLTTNPDTAAGILGGEARVRVQSLKPGTRLIAAVTKAYYATLETELFVDGNVLEVTPKEIPFTLDVQTLTEASQSVELANLTPIDQEITSIKLNGAFAGLIDEKKTNEALNALTGIILKAKEKRPLNFRVFTSNLAKGITAPRVFDAKILITSKQAGSTWDTEIPAKISLGLGGQVDDPTCFVITKKDWVAATRGEPLRMEFEIENNCAKNASPVTLRNVQAKVQPATGANSIGYFTLTIGQTEQELRPGFYKLFASSISEGERVPAVLTFTPRGGYYAGTSKADVLIMAENPTTGGIESLESRIKTEIDIVNLKECIGFDKDFLVIDRAGQATASGSFNIETSKCKASTDFKILNDELKKFGVQIDKTSFSLQENGSQKVTVSVGADTKRGAYAIPIQAKPLGKGSFEDIRSIELKVIDSTACIELSKYEFDLYQKAGATAVQDFTDVMIMPWCYEKQITITYTWDIDKEAEKKAKKFAWGAGLLGGVLTGVGNAMAGKNIWTGEKPTGICGKEDLATASCLAEDKCADIKWAGGLKQGQYGCAGTLVCCQLTKSEEQTKINALTKTQPPSENKDYAPKLKSGDKLSLAPPNLVIVAITNVFKDKDGMPTYEFTSSSGQKYNFPAEQVDKAVTEGTYKVVTAVAPTTAPTIPTIASAYGTAQTGGTIVINGAGFKPGEQVILNLGSADVIGDQLQNCTTLTAGTDGKLSSGCKVPPFNTGDKYIWVTTLSDNKKYHSTNTVSITPAQTTAPTNPTVTVSPPTDVAPGTKVTITLTGFTAGENLNIYVKSPTDTVPKLLNSSYIVIASTGSSTYEYTVPTNSTSGAYEVDIRTVLGNERRGIASFTVKTAVAPVAQPKMVVSPKVIMPGGSITVTLTGFYAGQSRTIAIYVYGPQGYWIASTPTGGRTITSDAPFTEPFTMASNATSGNYTVKVYDILNGVLDTTKVLAQDTFVVGPLV